LLRPTFEEKEPCPCAHTLDRQCQKKPPEWHGLHFRKATPDLTLRDELDTIYADSLFAALFPKRGQPAEAPGRLALVTVLQFAEGLSDRQAAEAVRSRIDWKYLLGLELVDPGFDFSVLSEFRDRLQVGGLE
jgi:transposase